MLLSEPLGHDAANESIELSLPKWHHGSRSRHHALLIETLQDALVRKAEFFRCRRSVLPDDHSLQVQQGLTAPILDILHQGFEH